MKTLVKVVLILALMALPLSMAHSKSLGERWIEREGVRLSSQTPLPRRRHPTAMFGGFIWKLMTRMRIC